MWIKNAKIFTLPNDFKIDQEKLSGYLAEDKLKPCGPQDLSSQGWVSPFNNNNEMFCLESGDAQLIKMAIDEKILPSAAVNQRVDEKVNEITNQTGHKVSRKQKTEIKQEIMFDLLPCALTKLKNTTAYIDNKLHLLVVDASSQNQAENLVSQLRQTLGSFKAQAYGPSSAIASIMTNWITSASAPDGFDFGSSIVLETLNEAKSVIRAKNVNFNEDEIQRHIDNGYLVTQIQLTFNDRIEFTLTYDFAIKGIKFTDLVQDELDNENIESQEQLLDSRFALTSLELRSLFTALFDIFPDNS